MTSIQEQTIDELRSLRDQIDIELKRREAKERADARKKIQEIAAAHHIDLSTIAGGSKARYRDPQAPSRTWTGKGRKPKWVQEHLKKGGTIEELELK